MTEDKRYDEEIIKIRNKYEQYEKDLEAISKEVPNDIANGYIKIDGTRLLVEERNIDDRILITIPQSFDLMDPEYVELKYPAYKNENKQIFTNEETTINIAFDFREREMREDETETVRDQLSALILKLHPSSSILDKGTLLFEEGYAAYFDLVTPALDQDIYNFMFFFELDGDLAIGTFNCYETEKHNWTDIVRQMVTSIKKL